MTLLYSEHKRLYFWNAVVSAAATYMALYIPLGLELPINSIPGLEILYYLSCLIFLGDIYVRVFRFNRDRANDGSTWNSLLPALVLVDIVPAIPFVLLMGPGYLSLLHLVKLVRVAQFIRMFKQTEVKFSITLTLIAFAYWAVLLIHLLACGWMDLYGVKADVDGVTSYISSLYWTITSLTSVGYGDIVPLTNAQRLYAILVEITGIAVFGYLIGNVVTILSKLDASNARYQDYVEHLATATKRRGLSKDLQRRVLDYYRYMRDDKTGYDESAFLQTLPESLRTEVALHLKKEFIEGIPLFRNAGARFIADVALKLELMVATPGDYIFKADDPADTMYFVVSGDLEVIDKNENKTLARLKTGDFFGEIALFRHIPRTASVRTTAFCNLYKLDRKTFESVLVQYPDIAKEIEREASRREQRYFEA